MLNKRQRVGIILMIIAAVSWTPLYFGAILAVFSWYIGDFLLLFGSIASLRLLNDQSNQNQPFRERMYGRWPSFFLNIFLLLLACVGIIYFVALTYNSDIFYVFKFLGLSL